MPGVEPEGFAFRQLIACIVIKTPNPSVNNAFIKEAVLPLKGLSRLLTSDPLAQRIKELLVKFGLQCLSMLKVLLKYRGYFLQQAFELLIFCLGD